MPDSIAPSLIDFTLSSDACALLSLLAEFSTTTAVARHLEKDPSVVSRQISALSTRAPLLLKRGQRWKLTDLGMRVVQWYRDAAFAQRTLLNTRSQLRLATTSQFAERVLTPGIDRIVDLNKVSMTIVTAPFELLEAMLLADKVDIAINCGRPNDPEIRYRRCVDEPLLLVASPQFLHRHRPKALNDLLALPYVQVDSLNPRNVLRLDHELEHVAVRFSDIGPARQACIAGLGWSILPAYAIKNELSRRELKELPFTKLANEQFGIWWLRSRPEMTHIAESVSKWLVKLEL